MTIDEDSLLDEAANIMRDTCEVEDIPFARGDARLKRMKEWLASYRDSLPRTVEHKP